MKKIKYSKNYNNIFNIKNDFYKENEINLKNIYKINSVYSKQKKRTKCKNCNSKLNSKFFTSFGINYTVCGVCKHLNGMNKDTKNFVEFLYQKDSGDNYSKNYLNDFDKRVKNIYLPKVSFLKKIIKKKINIIDIGSGGGHFLRACEIKKILAEGYEPNKQLVKLGKKKLKKNQIYNLDMESIYNKVVKSNANTLSLIGVLEHLEKPNEIITLFKKSKLKYLYISVPLLSLSSFIENSFKNIFPRQLSAGHTHLYTKESLYYLAKKNKLKVIGEWWFGTDFPDLYRSLINSSNSDLKKYNPLLQKYLFSVINELQHVLDKNKICSEVHMILKK